MSEELKTCPFCGSESVIDADYGQEYWCECRSCKCRTGKFRSRHLADQHWNTRSELAAPASADARLVPVGLMRRLAKRVMLRSQEEAHADACDELRALLARSE